MIAGKIPLMTILPSNKVQALPHDLLIIYGGTTEPNFRFVVRNNWGEPLARLGFTVYCFDFQSNLPKNNFYDFGLWDRTVDAIRVLRWLLDKPFGKPLTLIGVSMGGHIATQLAGEFGNSISNLILVAPAAYHDRAIRPSIKFSPTADGEFTRILRDENAYPWRESSIFTVARNMVRARPHIMAFCEDEVVKEIPFAYFEHFVRGQAVADRPAPSITVFPGRHAGNFADSQRIALILDHIADFLR